MKTPADGWDCDERETLDSLDTELELVRARHAGDPPADLLRAAHHDALPAELQSDAAEYLGKDPWSRAIVAGLDDAEPTLGDEDQARLLERIQRDARRSESPASSMWRWPLLAGAAALSIVAAVWVWRSGQPPAQTQTPRPDRQVAVARPSAPRLEIPLEKPEVMLSAAALTWRGAGSDNPLLVDLKPAIDAFRRDDYGAAAQQFAALETRYPNAIEVFYYGGVSRLFVNDPIGAGAALGRAAEVGDEVFAPHVAWYLAIAEQRAGRDARAREQLAALCAGSSVRAARACEVLKQLGTPAPR